MKMFQSYCNDVTVLISVVPITIMVAMVTFCWRSLALTIHFLLSMLVCYLVLIMVSFKYGSISLWDGICIIVGNCIALQFEKQRFNRRYLM